MGRKGEFRFVDLNDFMSFIKKTDGCWLWRGSDNGNGYGKISFRGQHWFAHRLSWELHRGPIPTGLLVCHRCDVPACVNPDHLFLGTMKDNIKDASRKGRIARGERHGMSKLREDDVIAIRQRYSAGESYDSMAKDFGVSWFCIRDVSKGNRWKHC